jgi:hypothetical protein
MGKPKPPPPPDYSGVAAASERAAELSYKLGQEQLAWAREQYDKDAGIYNRIVDGFLMDMSETSEHAREDRAFYEKFFQPLEQELAEEAKNYDTPERRAREMGRAQANVAQQFDAQRENAQRELEAYGIDPSSTRYGALDIGVRTAQAAAQAGAGEVASNRVEDVGRALRSEAINVGRGYPGQIAGSYATSGQMGSGAGGTTGNASQIGGQNMGTAPQYLASGNQAIGTWGNTLNMGYQNQLAYFDRKNQSSGWGSALGLIGGIAGKAFGLADGGVVPDPNAPQDGGAIPDDMSPSGGAIVDDVPARLNAGEFVVPDDVVSWYGEKHMYGLIEKAARERDEAKQRTGAIPEPGPALEAPPVYQSA